MGNTASSTQGYRIDAQRHAFFSAALESISEENVPATQRLDSFRGPIKAACARNATLSHSELVAAANALTAFKQHLLDKYSATTPAPGPKTKTFMATVDRDMGDTVERFAKFVSTHGWFDVNRALRQHMASTAPATPAEQTGGARGRAVCDKRNRFGQVICTYGAPDSRGRKRYVVVKPSPPSSKSDKEGDVKKRR